MESVNNQSSEDQIKCEMLSDLNYSEVQIFVLIYSEVHIYRISKSLKSWPDSIGNVV